MAMEAEIKSSQQQNVIAQSKDNAKSISFSYTIW